MLYADHVIDPVTLIVLILATMRLTRMVTWDKITMPLRAIIIKKTGTGSWLSYLAHCVFCVGFYASFLAIPIMIWPHNKYVFTCYLILAVAEVAPRLLNWEPRTTGGE